MRRASPELPLPSACPFSSFQNNIEHCIKLISRNIKLSSFDGDSASCSACPLSRMLLHFDCQPHFFATSPSSAVTAVSRSPLFGLIAKRYITLGSCFSLYNYSDLYLLFISTHLI